MKYLSFDIEATGLNENDYIIEFAMVPFCTEEQKIRSELSRHYFIKCPPYEQIESKLDQWVKDHNKDLIIKANSDGIEIPLFKNNLELYLNSNEIKSFFGNEKIVLFGKSMNAIDLPFLNRDLGWDFMRHYFHHQVLDLSSVVRSQVDLKKLPSECISGSKLMAHFNLGEVAHTALEDAINTAKLYLKMLA